MHHKKLVGLDAQMLVVRNFIDEFYNKTLFKNGTAGSTELAPSVIKILYAIHDETKEYPIGELGKNARVKSSTITDIMDRLEQDGIAARVRDSRDRRIVRVRLTEKGKKIKKDFSRKRRAEFQALLTKLGEEETRQLIYHLDEAYKLLKKTA